MGNHLSGNGNYLHSHGNLFPKVLCCDELIKLLVLYLPDANAYCAEFADCRNVIYSSPRAGLRISVIRNIIIIIITVSLIINNFSTDRMGLGGNGN